MGIIIGFIFFCIIFFIVCACIGTKGQSPRQYHNYGHDYDDEDFDDERSDYADFEIRSAKGKWDYFSDDPAQDYCSYYSQVADNADMGDRDSIDEMNGEW